MAYDFTAASSQRLTTSSSPASGSPMTICAWAKPTTGSNGMIGAVGDSGTHRNQIQTNNGDFAVAAVGSLGLGLQQFNTYTQNVWSHFAGVFSSSTSRVGYVNGTAGTANTANIGSQNPATEVLIGIRRATSFGFYFNGDIAEFGVWNVALTQPEIAALAKGMSCDKIRPQNLVFYAPLVRDLIDQKGGLTITNNNGATVANHTRVYA